MKEFRLSTPAERITGVCFVTVILAAFGLLVYTLRTRIGLMIACALAVVLIGVPLVIYVINVMKASCVANAQEKTLEVRGLSNYTLDLSEAVLLQTLPRKSAQTTLRVLVFTDAQEKVIATVPTMFTFKQGVQAEPTAKELAAALGIEFRQNVPEWEYDQEKYKEHEKEVAEQQKQEAKERRRKRMELRIQKRKKQ